MQTTKLRPCEKRMLVRDRFTWLKLHWRKTPASHFVSENRGRTAHRLGHQTFPAGWQTTWACMGGRFSFGCATFETKAGPLGPLIKIFILMVLPRVTENPYSKLEVKHFSGYIEIWPTYIPTYSPTTWLYISRDCGVELVRSIEHHILIEENPSYCYNYSSRV